MEKLSIKWLFKLHVFHVFIINVLIILSVIFLHQSFVQNNKQYHFSKYLTKNSIIIGRLKEVPEEKEKTYKGIIRVEKVINNKEVIKCRGKLLVYFKKSKKSNSLFYGDVLLIKGTITEVAPSLNPAQFDFKKFLSYKRIYHQAFLNETEWIETGINHSFQISYFIIQLRQKIIEQIKIHVKNTDEQSIAMALLVGYQTELSNDVKFSFISTGAMHVLSVSGLHVGLIFLVFSYLTRFLKKKKRGKIIYLILNLLFLWVYAILTGFSPSVLRATTMFSFVLIGQNSGRIPNIYSSLYFSLFILLLFDPLMISQVGFQLSYAAVIGIVALQPRIYNLIKVKNVWILDKIWALTSVSLAAQLATFPLGLFYFTQFPVYFLISNLLVIPISTFILYAGFVFLITIPIGFDFLNNILSWLLNASLWLLNHSVTMVQNWPKGLISEIYISLLMTLLIYLLIFLLIVFLVNKQRKYFLYLLTTIVLIYSGSLFWKIKNKTTSNAIIYSIKGHQLIGFFDYGKVIFWGDSSILNDYETLKYNTFRDVWKYGQQSDNITKVIIGSDFKSKNLLIRNHYCIYNNTRFVIDDFSNNKKDLSYRFKTDYLLISNLKYAHLKKICNIYCSNHVFVNINPLNKKWLFLKNELNNLNMNNYNLAQAGAYQINYYTKPDFQTSVQNLSLRIKEICGLN